MIFLRKENPHTGHALETFILLIVSLYNFSRSRGRVRPDGGKESWFPKGASLPVHSDTGTGFSGGLFRTGSSHSTSRPQYLADFEFSESLFPGNPPSYKSGLSSLFLEAHPWFCCAAMNVVCLCQLSHLRLYQWPTCSFSVLRTLTNY